MITVHQESMMLFNEYSGLISKVAIVPSLKGKEMLPSITKPASKPQDFTVSLLHFCLSRQHFWFLQRVVWYISRIMYTMFKSSEKASALKTFSQSKQIRDKRFYYLFFYFVLLFLILSDFTKGSYNCKFFIH